MRKNKGTVLVTIFIVTIILAAGLLALVSTLNNQIQMQGLRTEDRKALFSALEGAYRVKYAVEYSPYDTYNNNEWVKAYQPTNPGESLDVVWDDGGGGNQDYTITMTNLGDYWFEIVSTVPVPDMGYEKQVSFMMRERTSLAEYQLFVNNGAVVADHNRWFGKVHSNSDLGFRNMYSGIGAKFFDHVTYSGSLVDRSETGGVAEAEFLAGADQTPPVEWPDVTQVGTLVSRVSTGVTNTYNIGSGTYGQITVGPNGIHVIQGTTDAKINVNFVNDEGDPSRTGKIEITATTATGTPLVISGHSGLFDIPNEGLLVVDDDIDSLKGEVNGRVTVVSADGDIHLPDDLVYEDNNGQQAYIHDPSKPLDEDFYANGQYQGDSVLGVIAGKSILFSGKDDDADLELHGIFASGLQPGSYEVWGLEMWGAFRWWQTSSSSTYGVKNNLRVYGSIISNGYHYKGFGGSGGHTSGYLSSAFAWDLQKPPHYITIKKPAFTTWRISNVPLN